MRRHGAILPVLALSALAGCRDGARAQVALPPDPPGVTKPAEYFFGDATRRADWRAQRHVLDQLEAKFGQGAFRLETRNAPGGLAPEAIRAHYEAALVRDRGWRPFALDDHKPPRTAWSAAYQSPDGRVVIAVVALLPEHAVAGQVPLTLLTNLELKGRSR